jgi:hypothetical protein
VAFAEATVLPTGQSGRAAISYALGEELGKGIALTVLALQLARTVYHVLKRPTAFERDNCLNGSGSRAGESDAERDRDRIGLHSVLDKALCTVSLNARSA